MHGKMMDYTHLIVGGGIYGCYVALQLRKLHPDARIAIIEREAGLFRHASYNNQARVHNGYHYPRSILTGIRSRANVPRFMREFGPAIVTEFGQYYAIGRRRSNVTPGQFEQFCHHIGAELSPAPSHITGLFDEDLVEAVYSVSEPVFDADKLRAMMQARIEAAKIPVLMETEAVRLDVDGGASDQQLALEIFDRRSAERCTLSCRYIYNCTYSRLNELLGRSRLTTIRLRHEATEMALVDLPPGLRDFSVTIMCGPFFSLMPFPPRGLSTLSHVSYTPHYSWTDEPGEDDYAGFKPRFPLQTRFNRMWRDASRYLPALSAARYVESLWEVKTILPQSDANDSRPILFKQDPVAPNVVSILGGKIDNIFDLDDLFTGVPSNQTEMSRA
jgi:glycine/D-amino acid oxidase-like deaminating enzyme